jgi:hypothetical protein
MVGVQIAGLMGCSAESVKAIEVGRRELTLMLQAARALGIKDLVAFYGSGVSYTRERKGTCLRQCEGCADDPLLQRIERHQATARALSISGCQAWRTCRGRYSFSHTRRRVALATSSRTSSAVPSRSTIS